MLTSNIIIISISIFVFIGIILTYLGYISDNLDTFLIKISFGIIIILLSFMILMVFMNKNNIKIEGFIDNIETSVNTKWLDLIKENKLTELCKIIETIQTNLVNVEKGTGSTELQAREYVDKYFQKNISAGTFNCSSLKEENDIDTLYVNIIGLDDNYLIQAYQTAAFCQSQLQESVNKISLALIVPIEGFTSLIVKPCSPEITEERRKFLRQKKLTEEQQGCLLPEEVSTDFKENSIISKMKYFQSTYDKYRIDKKITQGIPDIINNCISLLKELNKFKEDASSGKIISQIITI